MKNVSERVEFSGAQGDLLAARLEKPAGATRAFALFAHCFSCSKDVAAASRISRALAERGIAVLRFDFTGLGHSQGDFANTSFSSNVQDLLHAAAYLREHHRAPALLIGHSLGGAAVLAAAPQIPESVAVATLGAPADPAHVTKLFAERIPEIESRGEAEVDLAGRRFRIRRDFLEDIASQKLEQALHGLKRALLVMHSPVDGLVDIDNASRIFQAARHPKSFISLDRADHLLTRREDSVYVAATIAAWAERYLPQLADSPGEQPQLASEGEVVVTETGDGRFSNAILAGPHRLQADEPPSLGGDDAGPTPYDLLLASLGACTSMTLRMYAERKKLPLERVSVRLRHSKIHARDCEQCETNEGRLDHIEKTIELSGELDDAQRQRLLEIADRCPVHRTLRSEILVSSELAT